MPCLSGDWSWNGSILVADHRITTELYNSISRWNTWMSSQVSNNPSRLRLNEELGRLYVKESKNKSITILDMWSVVEVWVSGSSQPRFRGGKSHLSGFMNWNWCSRAPTIHRIPRAPLQSSHSYFLLLCYISCNSDFRNFSLYLFFKLILL